MSIPAEWVLAIDFGTSFTVAAVRVAGRPADVIEIDGDRRMASVVYCDEGGAILVGRTAEDRARFEPSRALRSPKVRIGDKSPIILGGRPYRIVDLVGALLAHVGAEAHRHMGSAPAEVRLTHPATWSRTRQNSLLDAAAQAGLLNPTLVLEPVAAALSYADEAGVPPGGHVLVYDLGGGTFDSAILLATDTGFSVVGRPVGDPTNGGELFDEILANLIGERLEPSVWEALTASDRPEWQRAASALRVEARRAKEALSAYDFADVLVSLPTGMVQQRVTRDEFEALVRPYVEESVEILDRVLGDAELDARDVTAIYLAGGASRTPLVGAILHAHFPDTPVSRRGDPKLAVALGATYQQATPAGLMMPKPATSLDEPTEPPPIDVRTPDTPQHRGPTVLDHPIETLSLSAGDALAPPAAPLPLAPSPPSRRGPLIIAAAVAVVAVTIMGIFVLVRDGQGESADDAERTSEATETIETSADTASEACDAPDAVKLQLQWFTQGQFGGYFAAQDQGYYADECLEVEIVEGGVDIAPQNVVASGQADFAIAWVPRALASKFEGAEITNIAQVFQRSATLQVSWKDSGIATVEDLAGKKVGNWGFGNEFELFAGLTQAGLDPTSDVELVQQQFDMVALTNRDIDAAQALTYNGYAQMLETPNPDTGELITPEELNVIDWNDVGTAMLQDALWVETTRLDDEAFKDTAVRFLKASMKGWAFCRDDAQACADIVLAAGPAQGASHQLWQVNEINKLIWPSPDGIGVMDQELWDQTVEVATAQSIIPEAPDADAFTTELAQQAVDELTAEGVDVTGESFEAITVELQEGGA